MPNEGPAWLGIGAQRSGTTWFTDLLIEHPLVDVPRETKEHHYLYRFGLVRGWNKTAKNRYQKLFSHETKKLGEFTPYYMRSPSCAWVAKQALPEDAPILVLLRDPVDRFASALRHDMETAAKRYRRHLRRRARLGGEALNGFWPRKLPDVDPEAPEGEQRKALLDETLMASSKTWVKGRPRLRPHAERTWLRYVTSDSVWGGMYATQLDAWTEFIPKHRFIVIQYEKLRKDPQAYADLVWRRIGLEPVKLQGIGERSRSSSDVERWRLQDHPNVLRALKASYRAEARRLADEWDMDLSLWKRTMGAD